jgi:hypothetical protein
MRRALILAALAACGTPKPSPPRQQLSPAELALRAKLGIPDDAQQVIVFGQNAHLDVDWQSSFDDYYNMWVGDIFTHARKMMDAQPRASYSIAEMAYLQHHLAVHPEERAKLEADVARGALHVVGGGMTSPDTLLPETELLARDLLYGVQFAEDTLGAHPTAAWLPDSFGHGAATPDVLAAAGYTSVAFARIDGAPDFYDEIMSKSPPTPGSTAAQLRSLGSDDFTWQGSGGAHVLAHFMAGSHLYCQGDDLDYAEIAQLPHQHTGLYKGDDPTFTDASIDRYVNELTPYTKTPYMFVPVGCDFADPKDGLVGYLDGYDGRRYPDSHVYAVAAPFDTYAALVGFHSDQLPTITSELAPYYTGYYGSRADLKRATRDAARPFFEAEAFATQLADGGAIVADAAPALSLLTRADHHDFVAGTSADDVVVNEQMPQLAAAQDAGTAELGQVAGELAARIPASKGATDRAIALNASSAPRSEVVDLALPLVGSAPPAVHAMVGGAAVPMELASQPQAGDTTATFRVELDALAPWSWTAIDLAPGAAAAPSAAVTLTMTDANGQPASGAAIARVVLANAHTRAQWDRASGVFALTSLTIDGAEAIATPAMTIHDYSDSGGLWRLGDEMGKSCHYTAIAPPAETDTVQVLEQGALRVRVAFVGANQTREAALDATSAGLDLAITTGAAQGTTRAVDFGLAAPSGATLATSVPGGSAARAGSRMYTPTYWAAVGWAQVGGWAILLRQSTGVRMDTPGAVELMAARDARQESCDILGGTGSDPGTHRIEWRVVPAAAPADAERAAQAFDRPVAPIEVGTTQAATTDLAASGSLVSIDGPGIVSAFKPAERGGGVILRVVASGKVTVHLPASLAGKQITAVDLAERDLHAIGTATDTLVLDPATAGSIASVRIR